MTKDPKRAWSDQYMLRMPEGLRDRLKIAAEARGLSMNALIVERLLEQFPEQEFRYVPWFHTNDPRRKEASDGHVASDDPQSIVEMFRRIGMPSTAVELEDGVFILFPPEPGPDTQVTALPEDYQSAHNAIMDLLDAYAETGAIPSSAHAGLGKAVNAFSQTALLVRAAKTQEEKSALLGAFSDTLTEAIKYLSLPKDRPEADE